MGEGVGRVGGRVGVEQEHLHFVAAGRGGPQEHTPQPPSYVPRARVLVARPDSPFPLNRPVGVPCTPNSIVGIVMAAKNRFVSHNLAGSVWDSNADEGCT